MSVVSSVNCPVCGAIDGMMQDDFYKQKEVFYHCHSCGYGNLFKEIEEDGEKYFKWDRRCEKRRFVKKVAVDEGHGLLFCGRDIPFYPIGAEFDEYSVYPRAQNNKLVWKLYSTDKKLLGEYRSLGDAFRVGDEINDQIKEP